VDGDRRRAGVPEGRDDVDAHPRAGEEHGRHAGERIDASMRRRVLPVLVTLAVAAWVAVVVRFVLRPSQDSPRSADAVVVLAGDHLRLGKALELMARRVAPTLVISDGLAPGWREANRLCRRGGGRFRVVCFRPDPYSTRGEARAVARMAAARGWGSVV